MKNTLISIGQMLITYGLQFLDKALLGYAAVYTLREDTVSLSCIY
jgi:hypothetical protein